MAGNINTLHPSGNWVEHTPSGLPLSAGTSRSVYIPSDGDLTFVNADTGLTVTVPGMKGGAIYPVRATTITAYTGGATMFVIY